jgi:transposase
MAKALFKPLPLNSPELFPVNIFDRIPKNHPVHLISDVVDKLDISNIAAEYKGGGTTSFDPRMMLKVLFYSYLSNIYSCRKIAKVLNEKRNAARIHFMWISGNSTPDFRTINNFRGQKLKHHIHDLFAEVVKMLQELQVLSLDIQYIDGTKIESAANKYTFVWRGSVEKNKAKLEEKIKKVLGDIDQQIQQDNQEANQQEVLQKIDSNLLKEKLGEINQKLKESPKSTQKQIQKLQDEHLPRLEKYEQQLQTLGNRNSFSKTDEDATFMRMKEDAMKNGQLKPAYNPQISTENQYITHYSIHQKPNDTTTLPPHLEGFKQKYNKQSKQVVTDSGYGSEENYEMLESNGMEAFVKFSYFHKEQKRSFKNDPFGIQNLFYNQEKDFYVCTMGQRMEKVCNTKLTSSNGYESTVSIYQAKNCQGCPLRGMCHQAKTNRKLQVNHRLNELKDKARALLLSPQGIEKRSKRPVEVEAVFGQLKSNNKFNRFTLRGLEKVNVEFGLMALGHNFRKWAKLQTEKFKNNSVLMDFVNNLRLINHSEAFKFDFVKPNIEKYSFL